MALVLKPAVQWREADTGPMLAVLFLFCLHPRDRINHGELSAFECCPEDMWVKMSPDEPEGTLAAAPQSAWLSVLYLGGLVTLGGFGLYNMAMRWIPASQAAMSINLVPLIALLMGWLWLDESLSLLQSGAALAIFGGVVLGQLPTSLSWRKREVCAR